MRSVESILRTGVPRCTKGEWEQIIGYVATCEKAMEVMRKSNERISLQNSRLVESDIELRNQIATLEAEREWISVEELPKRDEKVLALHVTGEIFHCRRAWNGEREVWAHALVDAGISDDRFVGWMPAPPQVKD